MKLVVVDTETTGIDPKNNEVLQVAMIDGDGETLMDTFVHPLYRERWPKAQEIHGISPADVKEAPYLTSLRPKIQQTMEEADLVIGYNLQFDLGFLGVDVPEEKQFDVMREFAKFQGIIRDDGSRKWSKLIECAAWYDYGYFSAHGALEDCKATLYCYEHLLEDPGYISATADKEITGMSSVHAGLAVSLLRLALGVVCLVGALGLFVFGFLSLFSGGVSALFACMVGCVALCGLGYFVLSR